MKTGPGQGTANLWDWNRLKGRDHRGWTKNTGEGREVEMYGLARTVGGERNSALKRQGRQGEPEIVHGPKADAEGGG